MKRTKAVGPDNIQIEVWRGLREEGIRWLTNLFNTILRTHKMLEEWRNNTLIPLFKKKGDAQVCGNYKGIKLLSHTLKLWERVIERRIRQETVIRETSKSCGQITSVKRLHGKLKTLCEKSTLTSFRLVALRGRNFSKGVEGDRNFVRVMINLFG